ncbi:MAG: copper chaperone PCu(A)C [Qingshengfaniella sp.]
MKKLAPLAALCALLPSLALAHGFTIGTLEIHHPYAFETAPAVQSGGGYMSITNTGDEADALIDVKADFPRVMLHLSEEKDGVATMRHADRIEIPAGATIDLAPGGYHVMFMGLDEDGLDAGEKIPATLVFEKAGAVEVTFNVEAREDAAEEMDHSGHGH